MFTKKLYLNISMMYAFLLVVFFGSQILLAVSMPFYMNITASIILLLFVVVVYVSASGRAPIMKKKIRVSLGVLGALTAAFGIWYQFFGHEVFFTKTVLDTPEAVSKNHTEVIATKDYSNAQAFIRRVNSAVVMANASSRFSDGGQLELGAEIGISTIKLHAYGPMGAESLTTEKFIVMGDGEVRA